MDSGREGSCVMGDKNESLGYTESELHINFPHVLLHS